MTAHMTKQATIMGMKNTGESAALPGTTLMAPIGQIMEAAMAKMIAIVSDFQKKTAAHPIPLRSR